MEVGEMDELQPPASTGDPDVSVIIEWDNARLSELDRALEMLHGLRAQAMARDERFEAILLYDRHEIEASFVEKAVADAGLDVPGKIDVRFEPVDGLTYYQLKNQGARISRGDILVFADSDTIPEPGWLQGVLDQFADPDVQIVAGSTYIGPLRNLYEKSFALFWLFPLRTPDGPAYRAPGFHANNVAFRSHTFERYSFPEEDVFRGHGSLLRTLEKEGVAIWKVPGARLMHPAPNGARHFLARGLCGGHDRLMNRRLAGHQRTFPLARVVGGDLRRLTTSFGRQWKTVGLSPLEVPMALGVGLSYEALTWAGWMLTRVSPRFVGRFFPV
jgi:hypothetical protein